MTHGLPAADSKLKKGRFIESILMPLTPGRLLDIGAGKGNISLTAARLGWHVTAVNADTLRWPEGDATQESDLALSPDSITFVQADVRELSIDRSVYDLISISGLHDLALPDQLALVRKCEGTPLLVDAHVAAAEDDVAGNYRGIQGQDHHAAREEREDDAHASSQEASGFQLTEESLIRLLRDCGYPIVFQARPPYRPDSTFYFALPSASRRR
jgi:SAM-dependent methyltransferase